MPLLNRCLLLEFERRAAASNLRVATLGDDEFRPALRAHVTLACLDCHAPLLRTKRTWAPPPCPALCRGILPPGGCRSIGRGPYAGSLGPARGPCNDSWLLDVHPGEHVGVEVTRDFELTRFVESPFKRHACLRAKLCHLGDPVDRDGVEAREILE